MSTSLLAGSLGMAAAMKTLDQLMTEQGVSEEARAQIINAASMMYEYIPYCIEQKKDITDGKVLRDFLITKGSKTLQMFGNDSVNCAMAIVDFLMSTKTAAGTTSTGIPPAIVLAYGLAVLDLISVGNSCEFAQQAYYEAFLRKSNVKLIPVRMKVQQYYSEEKRQCVAP